jgi:hypothetical protein
MTVDTNAGYGGTSRAVCQFGRHRRAWFSLRHEPGREAARVAGGIATSGPSNGMTREPPRSFHPRGGPSLGITAFVTTAKAGGLATGWALLLPR